MSKPRVAQEVDLEAHLCLVIVDRIGCFVMPAAMGLAQRAQIPSGFAIGALGFFQILGVSLGANRVGGSLEPDIDWQ